MYPAFSAVTYPKRSFTVASLIIKTPLLSVVAIEFPILMITPSIGLLFLSITFPKKFRLISFPKFSANVVGSGFLVYNC